jgi:hypothetical protein
VLVAEKSRLQLVDQLGGSELHDFTERMVRQAMEAIQEAVATNLPAPAGHEGNGAGLQADGVSAGSRA